MYSRIMLRLPFLVVVVVALVVNSRIDLVQAQQTSEVQLNQGIAKGYKGNGQDSSGAFEFLGLPYAKYQQFENPETLDRWSKEYGDKPRNPCPQVAGMGDLWKEVATSTMQGDQLLTLDVYVKSAINPSSTNRNPVVVYFPGGNYFANANSEYYSPKYLLNEGNNEFVLVVVNYRVGVFGFLSTGDEVIPGNFGLKDQQMALKWVNENIEKFGGDKNAVTLMGHESGAVSVSYHMLNRDSKNYFKRAIISGASLYSPWAFQRYEPWRARQQLTEQLKISAGSSHDLKEKLKKESVSNILKAQSQLEMGMFVPVLDNFTRNGNVDHKPFFEKDPIEAFENGEVTADIPVIFGMTKNPGAVEFFEALEEFKRDSDPLTTYLRKNLFPGTKYGYDINAVQKHQLESVVKGVKYLYFKHINSTTWAESVLPWIEFISDFKYNSAVDILARKMGKRLQDRIFVYNLEYQGPYTYGKYAYSMQNYKFYAPTVMDDAFIFFNNEEIERQYKPDQPELGAFLNYKQKLMPAWAKFFKDGNVNNFRPGTFQSWLPFSGNFSSLIIQNKTDSNTQELTIRSEYRSAKLEFFSVMVKELLWTNQRYYDDQETNQHFKSATWGLLAAFLILGAICILLLLYNIKLTKKSQKYNAVSTHTGSESVEFKGV